MAFVFRFFRQWRKIPGDFGGIQQLINSRLAKGKLSHRTSAKGAVIEREPALPVVERLYFREQVVAVLVDAANTLARRELIKDKVSYVKID